MAVPPVWAEMAVVGRIARTHGIRGQVIVNPETDFASERFRVGAELFAERGGTVQPMRVSSVHFHRDRPVIGLEGVETMTAAAALAGLELRIPTSQLRPLPAGTFYHHDLIGCQVETGEGRHVGVVKYVETAFGGSRLVVEGAAGEILVPLVAEICRTIDPGGRRIVIAPPDGLLDLNARSG
jgi:16S rRNA processing protein RimM